MVLLKIGLWFYNMCGVVADRNVYSLPLDERGALCCPATAGGAHWFYTPVRGWLAVVSPKGDGLYFNMEYRRLMCFYLWAGKQFTFEWAFRTFDIPNGDSLRTEEWIVPLRGSKHMHGSGGEIIACLTIYPELGVESGIASNDAGGPAAGQSGK